MDSTWVVDTSLDLNLNLLNPRSEVLKRDHDHHFDELFEELKRISTENKKLNEMLSNLYENYNNLHKQYMDLMSKKINTENENELSKKRKQAAAAAVENDHHHQAYYDQCSTSDEGLCKRSKETNNNDNDNHNDNDNAKISKVYVRIASNSTLIVKDGYQWRKYGQKVTRNNPSPRAYFKCSLAPSCLVKKKVQRSAEDPSILVATYEGEHNHPQLSVSHSHGEAAVSTSTAAAMRQSTSPPAAAAATLDDHVIQPGFLFNDAKKSTVNDEEIETPAAIQQILVQQMACNLTRDPNFTAALAAAISGRFVIRQ